MCFLAALAAPKRLIHEFAAGFFFKKPAANSCAYTINMVLPRLFAFTSFVLGSLMLKLRQ